MDGEQEKVCRLSMMLSLAFLQSKTEVVVSRSSEQRSSDETTGNTLLHLLSDVDLIDKLPENVTRSRIDIANTIEGKTPFRVHVEKFNESFLKRLLEDYSKGQRLRSSPRE
jgi:hypothetical protein